MAVSILHAAATFCYCTGIPGPKCRQAACICTEPYETRRQHLDDTGHTSKQQMQASRVHSENKAATQQGVVCAVSHLINTRCTSYV